MGGTSIFEGKRDEKRQREDRQADAHADTLYTHRRTQTGAQKKHTHTMESGRGKEKRGRERDESTVGGERAITESEISNTESP